MTWEELCALGQALPEVEEGIWFRTPALKVRGRSFVRLKADGKSVVFLTESVDEQEFLVSTRPRVYFITDHYVGWPAVLGRLAQLSIREARARLEVAWRVKAPKRLLAQRSDMAASPPRKKAAPRRR